MAIENDKITGAPSSPKDGHTAEGPEPGTIFRTESLLPPGSTSEYSSIVPPSIASSLDAIIVLGGGVPLSPSEPPVYVRHRCDVAAAIYDLARRNTGDDTQEEKREPPVILCLSAGTAHLPQLLSPDGLPVWESTASAAYLMDECGIPEQDVFAETASYDTISNAYFARTVHAEVAGWRRLLIVTNEFHMDRTKAIFDWIFHVEAADDPHDHSPYELHYLACDNVGLTDEAVRIRKEHEKRGERNVKETLSHQFSTLKGVWHFLTSRHDFYNARKLADRAMKGAGDGGDDDDWTLRLKDSYGGKRGSMSEDAQSSLLVSATVAAVAVGTAILVATNKRGVAAR